MSIDQTTLGDLTEIFRVLGDPTRLRILDVLSRGELCVGDLASRLRVTESAVSHQLRLLRGARIVRARRAGRMIFYSLDDTHVLTLFEQGLRHVQEAGHAQRPAGADADIAAKPAAESELAAKPSNGLGAPELGSDGAGSPKSPSGGGGAR